MIILKKVLFLLRNNYLLFSLILIHLIFLSVQVVNKNIYLSDSHEYLMEAENISNNGTFYCGNLDEPINNDLYTKRPPVYPLFIASVKRMAQSNIFIITIQSIISILSIFIIRRGFLKIGYNKRYDPLFLAFIILSPAQMVYANLIMAETLFQFTLALGFYTLVQYFIKNSIRYLLYFNLILAISALVKPVMYLFVYPSFIVMLYIAFKDKSIKPLLLGIIPIIIIQAYSFWNYKRTDYWHFSSIQTINLVHYNSYYFNAQIVGFDKAEQFLDNQISQANTIGSYTAKQKYLISTSRQVISENLFEYTVFHLKGMFRALFDPGRFDLSNFFGLEEKGNVGFLNQLNSNGVRGAISYLMQQNTLLIIALLLIGLANIIKVIGLSLFAFTRTIDIRFRLGVLALVGYIAFTAGPLGASRYMMPLIPFVILAMLTGLIFYSQRFAYL
ncbi:MAG: hypothetical protein EHM93_09420 [Bacteroidales bacterium]|nr:MAG: hypothetical protein EHM93_09420 [Bacteroidales bacterium]